MQELGCKKLKQFHTFFWDYKSLSINKILFSILLLVFFIKLNAQTCPTAPQGFSLYSSDIGVCMFKKDKNFENTYVQIINLNSGASLQFLTGDKVNDNGKGVYGASNPKFKKNRIGEYWPIVTNNIQNTFSICNGQFFNCTPPNVPSRLETAECEFCETESYLSFPIRNNGEIISGGSDYSGKELKILKFNNYADQAYIETFYLPNSSYPDIKDINYDYSIVGKDYSGTENDGRTAIGILDLNNDNKYESIFIIVSDGCSFNDAKNYFYSFGGLVGNIIFIDGGGSSTLFSRDKSGKTSQFVNGPTSLGNLKSLISNLCNPNINLPYVRPIPQYIAVISGKNCIKLNSPITITPNTINQCDIISIKAAIKNDGPMNWKGKVYISLHKMNDDFITDLLETSTIYIPSFETSTVAVEVPLYTIKQIVGGNLYKIYIKFQTVNNTNTNVFPLIDKASWLNPTFIPVNYSTNCEKLPIPSGNYKSIYLAGLNLNQQTNELEFLFEGVKANFGDPIVNVQSECDIIKKKFKQALVIPESNQWITLDINQSWVGDARTGDNFQNTDIAKDFLEADVKLKFSAVFKPITGFSAYTGTFSAWNNLINQGPYTSQIKALTNLYYPSWGVYAGIHSKNLNYSSQGTTKIIINDATMEMHKGILWTELDNSVNSLSSGIRSTLLSKLSPYQTDLSNRLSTGVNNTTSLLNSTGPQFQQLRNTYRITAAAHWYKTLTNYTNKPYHNLINSNNLTGIMVSPSYNDNYWNGQALQSLPDLKETFYYYTGAGIGSYSCVGGVSFADYEFIDSGNFNKTQIGIDTLCFNNKGNLTIDSIVYFYGGALNYPVAELSGIIQQPNQKYILDDTVKLDYRIFNLGDKKANKIPVKLYEQYFNSKRQIQNILISQFLIDSLDSFSSQVQTFKWIPNTTGYKKLLLTIDEGNQIIERKKSNNMAYDSLEILTNIPTSKIIYPTNGSSIGNKNIDLSGFGYDLRDGYLNDSSATWSSNINGKLGNGNNLNIDSLATGNHVITFKVTNSKGKTVSSQINLYVFPQGYPLVNINSPAQKDTIADNALVYFSGTSYDKTDGELCSNSNWISDIDGQIGTGCAFNGHLSLGKHKITYEAKNSNNKSSSATTNLVVVDGKPHVTVSSPSTNYALFENQKITLKSIAKDYPQGDLSKNVNWYSNIQGFLGKGQTLNKLLIPGKHIIKATIIDNAGTSDSATISVYVKFNPPVPFIIKPSNNQKFIYHDTITLIGRASDIQDGFLHKNSLKWYSNLSGFLGFGDTLKSNSLTYGYHILTLKATDSNGADSQISVKNIYFDAGLPIVKITQPSNNQSFFYGNSLKLKGNAIDPQDGIITGSNLKWFSNLDGNIGSGDSIQIKTLKSGNHEITLSTVDKDGFSGSDKINLTIEYPHPPSISIFLPSTNSHFTHSTTISLKANATDYEEGNLGDNRISWVSSISGSLGKGKTVSNIFLPPGKHFISATAKDTSGLTTTAQILIIIEQQKPVAKITSPVSESVFAQGTKITFTGEANDYEDGVLSGKSLKWKTETGIILGTGQTISDSSLGYGSHIITLVATDSMGAKDSSNITIIVQAPHAFLLRKLDTNADSLSHLFPVNGGDTIYYITMQRSAKVINAQTKVIGRSDLFAKVSISVSPSTKVNCNSNFTFTASYSNGGTNPVFQWKLNGNNVGTNSSTFSSSSIKKGDRITLTMTSNLTDISENIVISNMIIIDCTP